MGVESWDLNKEVSHERKVDFFHFPKTKISPRLFGDEQHFWYLGISTARDLHAEHVFRFRKVDMVPYPRPPTEKHFCR